MRWSVDSPTRTGSPSPDHPTREARLRLLQDAERHKITLSEHASATFYRPSYFPESGTSLQYKLTRQELEGITRPLVTAGVREIESLLDSVGMAPAQVSLCRGWWDGSHAKHQKSDIRTIRTRARHRP